MKTTIFSLALAASLAAAQPHAHGHAHGHLHQKKALPVEERDVVTTYEAATATAYVLGGKVVSPEDAEAGIKKGMYVVIGESTPTLSIPAVSSTSKIDAEFFQKTTTSAYKVATTSAVPTTTTKAAVYATTTAASSGSTGVTGIDADFPSGQLSCDTFPSQYGAYALPWLGTGGWASVQQVPDYNIGDSVISYIVQAISGTGCTAGSYCSYACPVGYVKTQWPASQGATGQSVGGLYCNKSGKLELSRAAYPKLCEKGVGGVSIVNKLTGGCAVCRTEYPGSESMVIPTWTESGGTYDLANVASSTYYVWQGKSTTLQYYVNPKNVAVQDACLWNSPTNPLSAGNWSPMNIGVGKDASGITYLSIFPNTPTSTATLDFDVVISGDIGSSVCYYKSGAYSQTNGCTVSRAHPVSGLNRKLMF
jgi:hypothetical protein